MTEKIKAVFLTGGEFNYGGPSTISLGITLVMDRSAVSVPMHKAVRP